MALAPRRISRLLGVLCLPAVTAAAQSTCRTPFADSVARRELATLQRVAGASVWDDYRLARHPLLLVADSAYRGAAGTPVCAAIWRADAPLEIVELPARPRLSTPLYGMIGLDPPGPGGHDAAQAQALTQDLHPATATALRSRGITRVVVLPFPMDFSRLGALGAALRQAGRDGAVMQADFAVHESFHLHVQFPAWLDQHRAYAWPAWDRQPDRTEMRDRCYAGTPEIASMLKAEHAALLAAYDLLDSASTARGRDTVIARARRFVELRTARRRHLDTVRVAQGERRISCALAEDIMELEEGVAQWIGHATAVRSGLASRAEKRGSYGLLQPEAFYQFGPLQLWVLDWLIGAEGMRDFTASLARSDSPEGPNGGLFARFDHRTRQASGGGSLRDGR
jgi:hypothetical protein